MSKSLIIVDPQFDFIEGSLLVPKAKEVIAIINHLMETAVADKMKIVFTQDWHPEGHGSFASTNRNEMFSLGELNGLPQIFWPDHCVQGTPGAEFDKDLWGMEDFIVQKGMDPNVDSYSAFYDNGHNNPSPLSPWLKENGIDEVYICGLALDYCVLYTALDAVSEGYKTHVILDATRAVTPEGGSAAHSKLVAAGVDIMSSNTFNFHADYQNVGR